MSPAIFRDLPEATYHADTDSLSSTGAKLLANIAVTPAEFRYRIDHPTPRPEFDFGHAAHAKVLGVGSPIRVIPESRLSASGSTNTKAAREFIEEARAEGAVPLKPEDAAKVDAMALALEHHADAARLLSHGEAEVSAYAEDPETGIAMRARADWLDANHGVCVDYKTSGSRVAPSEFATAVARYGYDQQDAWYRDVFDFAGIPVERFYFVAQTKEPPFEVAVHELDTPSVAHGRYLNAFAARRFAEHIASGDWPSHTGINLISTPAWRRAYDPELLTATIPADFEWSPS